MRDWRINFPLYNGVKEVHIMIEKGASLEKPTSYIVGGPVVFYGSSITQGGCASRPGNAYTHILCRWLGAELLNLGFSGNAKGEPAMAEYIASLRMSAFIMDYDHNAPDLAHLEATHSEFFKIIRHDHPNLPILLVSRPDFDSAPVLNAKRREVIRDTYKSAIDRDDQNVYFIDGQHLFGRNDRDACTVDTTHPNDLGFMRMAKTIYPLIRDVLFAVPKSIDT
jgi:lysophospholipase L1-like esterase